MNKLWLTIWLIGLASILAGQSPGPSKAGPLCTGIYAPGVVLVGLTRATLFNQAPLAHSGTGQEVLATDDLEVQALRVPAGQECAELEALRRDPRVAFAELDYAAHAADITPDDPGWAMQWAPAKIQAPAAWGIVTGTPEIVIAILDSGIQPEHEDLAAKLWTNPGEVPGNRLDDDGNGQVDDILGWHFFHSYTNGAYSPAEDADVRDEYGHGTHIAGIAAAASNNGRGIAGVAWGARLMTLKVLNEYGDGWYSDIAAGIVYAADNGARIINLSLGGDQDSETLRAAVDHARSRGALVLASAGNTGGGVLYPAAYEPVLAVAATDAQDRRASFSNYGPQVDLAAPGVDIYSTWYRGNYFVKSGTSMATPHVSGVAALVWSRRPDLTAGEVISTVLATADDIGDAGPDPYTGWGRVNAYRATAGLEPLPDLWVKLDGPRQVFPGQSFSYSLTYGNRGDRAAVGVTLTLRLAAGLASHTPSEWLVETMPAHSGPYTQVVAVAPHCATLCLGWAYTSTATIQAALADQTHGDNTSGWVTRVAWPLYLPVVLNTHKM